MSGSQLQPGCQEKRVDELLDVPNQSKVCRLGRTRSKSLAAGGLISHSLTELSLSERR